MENTEKNINKAEETLAKELESMSSEGLRDFFKFFYKLNHQHYNMIAPEQFEEFLEAFDSNPFKINEDKAFRKQLIENILKYSFDHMSLITARKQKEKAAIAAWQSRFDSGLKPNC